MFSSPLFQKEAGCNYISGFCCPCYVQVSSDVWLMLSDCFECRSGNQSSSYLDYKMRWFHHSTCRCCMQRQRHVTGNAYLWNFLVGCTWIPGWQVVIIIGGQFRNIWKKLSQRRRMMNQRRIPNCPLSKMVSCRYQLHLLLFCYLFFVIWFWAS